MNDSRDSPAGTRTAARPDPGSRLPPAWHEQTEHEVAEAYADGYHQALCDIAGRVVELRSGWAPIGRRTYAERVAERLAEMERLAAGSPGSTWRGRYPGGAVDWQTGRLLADLAAQIGAAA